MSNPQTAYLDQQFKPTGVPISPAKDVIPDWRTFDLPEIEPPDDTQIEEELNKRFDISTLFQQMRSQ